MLANADESFNAILELGFASSIRKEWEWRDLARGVHAQPRGVPRLAGGRDRPAAPTLVPTAGPRPARPRPCDGAAPSSTPTSASAPPTNVSDGGTSSMVTQAITVAIGGTR